MTMEGLYAHVGVSRQGFHKRLRARRDHADRARLLVGVAVRIRTTGRHPRMGCRQMYFFAKKHAEKYPIPFKAGRRAFEKTLLENGFRLVRKRVFHKTTVRGAFVFPNLIGGAALWGLDMVWVSDITYFEVWAKGVKTFFYLTVILDVYSRRCIGWSVSFNLQTENTSLPALEMALQTRSVQPRQPCFGLVFHSDGGGQYSDKLFLKKLAEHRIQSSMADVVYENPFVERFHSTLKNDYLIPWETNSLELLRKLTPQAVHQYNAERPHSKLGRKTPIEFEQILDHLPLCQRTCLTMKVVD